MFITVNVESARAVYAQLMGNLFETDTWESAWEDFDYWMRELVPIQAIETDMGYSYPFSTDLAVFLVSYEIGFSVHNEEEAD